MLFVTQCMVPYTRLSCICSGALSRLQCPHSTAHTVSHTALGVRGSAKPHRRSAPSSAQAQEGHGATPQTPSSAPALHRVRASLPSPADAPRSPGSGPAGKLRRAARCAPRGCPRGGEARTPAARRLPEGLTRTVRRDKPTPAPRRDTERGAAARTQRPPQLLPAACSAPPSLPLRSWRGAGLARGGAGRARCCRR